MGGAVIRSLLLLALLAGCAGGEIRRSSYEGLTIVEHVDMADQPDVCSRRYTDGCYQRLVVSGAVEHHIWFSKVGASYVRRHEISHAKGMKHTQWALHPIYQANCSTITVGAEGYPVGLLLCVDGKKEWVI